MRNRRTNQSGAPILKYALVSNTRDCFEKRGLFRYTSSGYIPKQGDLMIQTDRHIGIVENATKKSVETIEGNHSFLHVMGVKINEQ